MLLDKYEPKSTKEILGNRLAIVEIGNFLKNWKKGDAMQIDVLEQNEVRFLFNVTRCRYAEMYRDLGIPELGALLSCNRDFTLVQGFNQQIDLERTQTIMEGAPFCDFRFTRRSSG